jgi:AcrR family transcriptional regulator
MDAVLGAATDLFAERGPDAVTVREVADRAGVNHALIHRHFGTKEELLQAVLGQAVERMAEVGQQVSDSKDLAMLVGAMLRERVAIRLLGWALLSGYPVEKIWPDTPAIRRVQAVLENERPEGATGDPQMAVSMATALIAGFIVFEPWFERAIGLERQSDGELERCLHEAAQRLLDLAR